MKMGQTALKINIIRLPHRGISREFNGRTLNKGAGCHNNGWAFGPDGKALWALAGSCCPNTVTICRATPSADGLQGPPCCTPRQPACSQCPLQAVLWPPGPRGRARTPSKTANCAAAAKPGGCCFCATVPGAFGCSAARKRRCQCHLGRLVQP